MIKRKEYYVYVSKPSKYPVEYVGQGFQVVYLNEEASVIYDKETGVFKKGHGDYRCVSTLKRIRDGHYISEGAVLPAQYLGTGNSLILNEKRKELYRKTGYVFLLYTVPVVLTAEEVKELIHPEDLVKDL